MHDAGEARSRRGRRHAGNPNACDSRGVCGTIENFGEHVALRAPIRDSVAIHDASRARLPLVAVAVLRVVSGCAIARRAGRTRRGQRVLGRRLRRDPVGPPPDTLRADKVSCAVDPSYTVGAIANASGACPSTEYQHLPATVRRSVDRASCAWCPISSPTTATCSTCPIGVLAAGRLRRARPEGPARPGHRNGSTSATSRRARPAVGQYAWPYPSPARTYCTLTIF